MLVHYVLFWLKPELSPSDRTHFLEEVRKLSAIKTVSTIHVGTPAKIAERNVTDRSFDVSLTIFFKDGPAHDSYQIDPIHLAFVERNKASWVRVQVYDSED